MGFTSYSISDRTLRSSVEGYTTKPINDIFVQNKLHQIHPEMNPKNVDSVRECCDSTAHPNTVPVQLYLDVTGSMGQIPHMMIKDGLPTLISVLIQNGVPDVALMFGAIGDHECDQAPLQVAQFESGDAELDMWLTRTWLEGRGGSNAGESYLLAWYFAAMHTRTDAYDKRNKKGFVFTIGDEPCLPNLPISAIKTIMGKNTTFQGTSSLTRDDLLNNARQMNHVYHIHINHGGRYLDKWWKDAFGQNLIEIKNYIEIPSLISSIILSQVEQEVIPISIAGLSKPSIKPEIML